MYRIVNFYTKESLSFSNLVFTHEDFPVEVLMDLETIKKNLDLNQFLQEKPCQKKYLPLLPIQESTPFLPLTDEATPLLKSRSLGVGLDSHLYFKHDGKCPSSSFKDRGSALEVALTREFSAPGLTLASTGNMAASCATFAAIHQIPCYIFVPEGVPLGKLTQIAASSGHLIPVKGTFNDAAYLSEELAKDHGFYLAGDYAFRAEGQKTGLFEMLDQLRLNSMTPEDESSWLPEWIIVPLGVGTNMASYGKALEEYVALGLISRKPKLCGVQSTGANSIYTAFAKGHDYVQKLKEVSSFASAISVNYPLDGVKALHAIRTTEGTVYEASDYEILQAQFKLASQEGLFVETSAASSYVAVEKLAQDYDLSGKIIVALITGDGLKDSASLLNTAIRPTSIAPKVQTLFHLFDRKFFDCPAIILEQPQEPIHTDPVRLRSYVKSLTRQDLSDFHLSALSQKVETLEQIVRRKLSPSELKDALQETLALSPNYPNRSFQIEELNTQTQGQKTDLTLHFKKHDPDNPGDQNLQTRSSSASSPLLALMNALKSDYAVLQHTQLSYLTVSCREWTTEPLFYVDLKLTYKASLGSTQFFTAGACHYDLNTASFRAFEIAFNTLLKVTSAGE